MPDDHLIHARIHCLDNWMCRRELALVRKAHLWISACSLRRQQIDVDTATARTFAWKRPLPHDRISPGYPSRANADKRKGAPFFCSMVLRSIPTVIPSGDCQRPPIPWVLTTLISRRAVHQKTSSFKSSRSGNTTVPSWGPSSQPITGAGLTLFAPNWAMSPASPMSAGNVRHENSRASEDVWA